MLQAFFARLVALCIRLASLMVVLAVVLAAGSAVYVARHFAIDTNIN